MRLLLAGARNLDSNTEATTEIGVTEAILSRLTKLLADVLLPAKNIGVAQVWSGIMAFGQSKEPIVRQVSDRVVVGVRLGGMGVAIGSLLGDQLADMLGQVAK